MQTYTFALQTVAQDLDLDGEIAVVVEQQLARLGAEGFFQIGQQQHEIAARRASRLRA